MLNPIRLMVAALLVLSWSGLAYTQEPNPETPRREVAPRQEPRQDVPARDQQETKPPRPSEEQKAPPEGRQQTPRPTQQQPPAREEHGRTASQRPAGQTKSAHIPDPQFKANFGHQHAFPANRVITQTTIVPGQTQFIMAGYTFIILDPWPTAWLFTDDCYIDYVGGDYFLFDVFHPGVRVALLVIG